LLVKSHHDETPRFGVSAQLGGLISGSGDVLAKDKPALAREVGRRRFPPAAAEIIPALVERDFPFYDPVISESAVTAMNRFAQTIGLLPEPVPYSRVVATRFRDLWSATAT
jgi:hypothetical protein